MTATAAPPKPKATLALVSETTSLTDYESLQNEILIAQQDAKGAVFDYNNPKGNKAARSYIYNLRKLRTKVDRKRKDAKASVIEIGKRIDASAKQLEAQVTALIKPHEDALNEIERIECERISKIEGYIADIVSVREYRGELHDSAEIREHIEALEAIDPTPETFFEFTPKVDAELIFSLKHLREQLEVAQAREAAAAELARLREEAARREREDREAALRAEAAEQARLEEAERQEALRAEEEAERQAEARKRDEEAAEAALRAEAEAEQLRQEAAEAREEAARQQRESQRLLEAQEQDRLELEEFKRKLKTQEEVRAEHAKAIEEFDQDREAVTTTITLDRKSQIQADTHTALVDTVLELLKAHPTRKAGATAIADEIFQGTLQLGLQLNWELIYNTVISR